MRHFEYSAWNKRSVYLALLYQIQHNIYNTSLALDWASSFSQHIRQKRKKENKSTRLIQWVAWMVCRPYVICASFLSFSFFFGRTSRIKNIFITKACQVREIDNRQSLKEFLIYLRFNLQPAAQSVCWLLLLPVPVIIFQLPVVRRFDLHAGHPRRPRGRKKSRT